MAEYTVTSEMVRDFRNARERTAGWVSGLEDTEFYSPSLPRSELGGDDYNNSKCDDAELSDAESSQSVPPRLMLRYSDGRPDRLIPHMQDPGYRMSPAARSHYSHHPPPSGSRAYDHTMLPQAPEKINILPSKPINNPTGMSHHTRSKSLPRDGLVLVGGQEQFPPVPARIVSQPYPSSSPNTSPYQHYQSRPPIQYTQSHPAPGYPGYGPPAERPHAHKHKSASMAYPQAHSSRHPHYGTSPVYTYPPNVGPNGIIYSHSDPIPNSYYQSMNSGPGPYHSGVEDRSRSASRGRGREHRRYHSTTQADPYTQDYARERSRGRSGRSRSRSMGPGPGDSQVSFRTGHDSYYIVQNGKGHVMRAPGLTYSVSSHSTKSPTTPISAGPNYKRPFFQRILHFAERFSSGHASKASVHHGMHGMQAGLRRRHSTDHL